MYARHVHCDCCLPCTRCRFCSLDCDDYCSSIGAVFGEDCDCIQCPDDLEDPPFEMTTDTNEEDYQSCADADDGDTFCVEQVNKSICHRP